MVIISSQYLSQPSATTNSARWNPSTLQSKKSDLTANLCFNFTFPKNWFNNRPTIFCHITKKTDLMFHFLFVSHP